MAASSPVPPPPPLQATAHDVEITIVSAKQLKNVNWRNGPLVPYADIYLASNLRFSTLPDDCNSTRPVWNESFLLPYSSFSSPGSILSVNVFHSRHSETPKTLVGSDRVNAAPLLPDFHSSPWIIHSLDLLRPSGRPQGRLRIKVTLRRYESETSHPAIAPTPDYNFSPGAAYHGSSVSPGYYPACDFYPPPPPPPPAHAFVRPFSQPLPRPPRPPPPVRAHGNYHHDGNSAADSVYRPSAPVDFTYPAKECEPCNSEQTDFNYTTVSPRPRLSSSDVTDTRTPPHWSSNRSVLWRNGHNSVSLERERWVAPSVPTGISDYRRRRGLEEGSVTVAFGGLRLEEGNNAYTSNYSYSHGYGPEE